MNRLVSATTMIGFSVFGANIVIAQDCHDSNVGVCVPPDVSDVDCSAGRGDGPVYVSGPIRVVGPDPYGLDRDKDGIACEKG